MSYVSLNITKILMCLIKSNTFIFVTLELVVVSTLYTFILSVKITFKDIKYLIKI